MMNNLSIWTQEFPVQNKRRQYRLPDDTVIKLNVSYEGENAAKLSCAASKSFVRFSSLDKRRFLSVVKQQQQQPYQFLCYYLSWWCSGSALDS